MAEATLFVLLGGGPGVGKTAVVRRFLENRFVPSRQPTIGTDVTSVPLPPLASLEAQPALLVLCDPSHLERQAQWARLADGASACGLLLLVDPSRPETLREADAWLLRARAQLEAPPRETHALLLAHRQDVRAAAAPALGPHELDAYCAQRGLVGWMRTSAKYGRSVHAAMERLLEEMALPLLRAPEGSSGTWGDSAYLPTGQTAHDRLRAVHSLLCDDPAHPRRHASAKRILGNARLRDLQELQSSILPAQSALKSDGQLAINGQTGGLQAHDAWSLQECGRLIMELDDLEETDALPESLFAESPDDADRNSVQLAEVVTDLLRCWESEMHVSSLVDAREC
ncbi:hypothetical protein AB1Y20_009070 [Prymnesium parvum]|uniref:Uncharacterized protein n=1 Tax=Prymnesium parvum TaxID=97485 RepID=A0AB34JZB9_PRYPA